MGTPLFGLHLGPRQRARNLKPKTLEAYEDAIAHLLRNFADMRLGAISRRDIEAFIVEQTKVTRRRRDRNQPKRYRDVPLAPNTINKHLIVLKAMLGDAVEQGQLNENPAARVGYVRERDREEVLHFLQPAEIERLLEVAQEPWRTLYLVAVHTGLRRGELLGLRWRDADLRKGLLHVRRSLGRIRNGEHEGNGQGPRYVIQEATLKTRHSRRSVDLSRSTADALLALPAGDDPNATSSSAPTPAGRSIPTMSIELSSAIWPRPDSLRSGFMTCGTLMPAYLLRLASIRRPSRRVSGMRQSPQR